MTREPAILEIWTNEWGGKFLHSWLIDENSAFSIPDRDGVPRLHYSAAVDLGALPGPGHFAVDSASGRVAYPRPCVFQKWPGKEWQKHSITKMKLYPQAASAMLDIATAGLTPTVNFAIGKMTFNGPAEKGVRIGWSYWNLIVAWTWSRWEEINASGSQRHREMTALGYPHKPAALRKLCSRMGLCDR